MVDNYELRMSGSLQWNNFHAKFHKNPWTCSNITEGRGGEGKVKQGVAYIDEDNTMRLASPYKGR